MSNTLNFTRAVRNAAKAALTKASTLHDNALAAFIQSCRVRKADLQDAIIHAEYDCEDKIIAAKNRLETERATIAQANRDNETAMLAAVIEQSIVNAEG